MLGLVAEQLVAKTIGDRPGAALAAPPELVHLPVETINLGLLFPAPRGRKSRAVGGNELLVAGEDLRVGHLASVHLSAPFKTAMLRSRWFARERSRRGRRVCSRGFDRVEVGLSEKRLDLTDRHPAGKQG